MKIKHWITAAFLILILGVEAQPVKQYGQLSVKGNQLVSDKGEAVMLAGVSYGWHNWWPRFYNKSTVKWLAEDWHCDLVRAAMGVGPRGSYTDKPEWSTQLDRKSVV